MELGGANDPPPGVGGTAREVSDGGDVRHPHRGQHALHEELPWTDGERYVHDKPDELRHLLRGNGGPRHRSRREKLPPLPSLVWHEASL